MMTHIPVCSTPSVPSTTPVLNALCHLNGIGDKFLSVKSSLIKPLSQTLSRVTSLTANKLAARLPAVATVLNAWAGKELLSRRQVALWQEYLRNPNLPIDAALKNYLEPCFALLARYLLEQPVMKLLGGRTHHVAEFLHLEKANSLLDTMPNRQRLAQLYIDAKPGSQTLESEIQHTLLLMIGIFGSAGSEVKPRQLNIEIFNALYQELFAGEALRWEKNTAHPAEVQKWSEAEMEVKVQAFLTTKYAEQFSAQYVSSEMLVQLSGVPARIQSELLSMLWPADAEPTNTVLAQLDNLPPPPGIHIPFAGTLRTLSPAYQNIVLGKNSTLVLAIPVCPANRFMNTTTEGSGISLGGVGSATEDNMKLFLSNINAASTQVYFRSRHPATGFNAKLRPSPLPLLTYQPEKTDAPSSSLTDAACPVTTVEIIDPPEPPFLLLPSGVAGALQHFDQWFSQMLNPTGVAGQHLDEADAVHTRLARHAIVDSRPKAVPVNDVQYDRLSEIPLIATAAAPVQVDVKTASHACNLWQMILSHKPADERENGFARYAALITEDPSQREIGQDARFQDTTPRTPLNRLKILLLSLQTLITRPDEDSPFVLDEKEFAYLQNDQRSGWSGGLAIMSDGEPRARLRLLGKMILPVIEVVLKAIDPATHFAGFASINSNIIAGLTEAAIPTITIKEFARLTAEKTAAFCEALGQQFAQLTSLDLARIRLLLDEQCKDAFPVTEFAAHPKLQDETCFSELGLSAPLAAPVVADHKRSAIPLQAIRQIALFMLLNQKTGTLINQLGQTTYVSPGVKKKLTEWWEEETQTFADVLDFVRARRALDKILLHPHGITPLQLAEAKTDVQTTLRTFYRHTFLDLPREMRHALKQNYPQPLPVTFIQVSRPEDSSLVKPCLGIIIQHNAKAYMVTPLPKIGDATRHTWFDVTEHQSGSGFRTEEQKQALMNILFRTGDASARHQLTLTTSLLRFAPADSELWAANLAEIVVKKMEQLSNPSSAASLPPTTSTTASAESLVQSAWSTTLSLLFHSPLGECLSFVDNLFGLGLQQEPAEQSGLVKLGSLVVCVEQAMPEGEAWTVADTLVENGVQQAFRQAKRYQAKYRITTEAPQEDTAFIKWLEYEMKEFMDSFPELEDLYAHRDLKPWLAPQMQPSWSSLSKADYLPEPTSLEKLNELAGYAHYLSDEEGKEYIFHPYGDSWLKFEVASTSLSQTGEVRYHIPAGAPADRMVTVIKDAKGNLQVVADNLIRLLPSDASNKHNDCELSVPQGISVEEMLISTFNDNRLVIKIKTSEGETLYRMLCASGAFIPFEPQIFANIPYRMGRGIENDPSTNESPIFRGRYALSRIYDTVRRHAILELYNLRKKLVSLRTVKELEVDIICLANQVHKLPAHLAMLKHADSLPESDITLHGFLELSQMVEEIARGVLTSISPELSPDQASYKEFLRKIKDAGRGINNIIKVFGLPGSDHALTQHDIDSYATMAKKLVNFASVFKSEMTSSEVANAAFRARQLAYIDDYGDQIFKADDITEVFLATISVPEELRGIRYVGTGSTVWNKFPWMRKELEQIDNEDRLNMDKISAAISQNANFIAQSLKKIFHVTESETLDVALFEKLLHQYRITLESDTEYRIKVFKDAIGYNPKTKQYALIKMKTMPERELFSWNGLNGFATGHKKRDEIAVSCANQGHKKSLATTVRHEDGHNIIRKFVPHAKKIIGEPYLDWPDRQRSLVRSEQRELLHKLMSAPAVFRAYIQDLEEFTRTYFHACVYSSNAEIARLASEIRDSWAYPVTESNQQKIDRIIDILATDPKLKIEPALPFPDFFNAMVQQLVESVPKEVADRVEAEWDPTDWRKR
ncbi:hypothetical protein L579_1236 [Pantoea sp. AS-PWVM4]|nr:hypothetical protein L579_1236 [Pantoea sp. AS-PWVM4]